MTDTTGTPAAALRRPFQTAGHYWALTTVIDALWVVTARVARFWRVPLSGRAA